MLDFNYSVVYTRVPKRVLKAILMDTIKYYTQTTGCWCQSTVAATAELRNTQEVVLRIYIFYY